MASTPVAMTPTAAVTAASATAAMTATLAAASTSTPAANSTSNSASTPSPASSSTTAPSAQQQQQRGSRRPSRKSTLTQQQKNHKRQRATQDQLNTLELEFDKNPTPTAATRERIAEEINMTERSVQIWFQNRRAKIKMIAKKGLETGEDCDTVPDSMRQYLAMHLDPTKAHARNVLSRSNGYPIGGPNAPGKIMISHFACRSLRIGTWRRVGQSTMDLVIFYSPDKSCMTYYINNDSAGYKIEYPFSAIKNIVLESNDAVPAADGSPSKVGGLVIELYRPPTFFMDPPNSGGFYQCGDFTEDQQASKCMVHHLGGHPKVLSMQLAKLISLDSFRNRHTNNPDLNGNGFPPQPASEMIHRPASQPNQVTRPASGAYRDQQFLHPHRGHKRQRSRSVPVPVDFAAMQTPVPAFHLQQQHQPQPHPQQQQQQHLQPQLSQQPHQQHPPPPPQHHAPAHFQANPNLYAPIPQARHTLSTADNPDLHVDTSNGYNTNLDFRAYPMSAATTASSSEFASPSFFACTAPPPPDPTAQLSNMGPSYTVPFLSPSPMADQASMMAPSAASASPLSQFSHTEPLIANQSPPLSTTQHSTAEEMFSMSTAADSTANMTDDGLLLSEMYSKQTLNMSAPSPGMDDSGFGMSMQGLSDSHSPTNSADYHGLLPFESLDPNTLGTETS